jgi:mRNA interferase MazF
MTEGADRPAEAGDVVWVDFGETRGREQAGPRPALVITSASYHDVSEIALVCPITRNTGEWAFKVKLPPGEPVQGAVLVDQIRAVDRSRRGFKPIGAVSADTLWNVRAVLAAMIGVSPPPP